MGEELYANPSALVSADWLAAHLDDSAVRVVEVDVSPKSYDEGHIPGAVLWDIYKDLKDKSYRLLDAAAFERILGASGITPSTKVVLYGYGPVLGYWLLKLYGHRDASVLNLAKSRWHDDGRPWTTQRSEPRPTHYTLPAPIPALRVLQPAVVAKSGAQDCAILDVRSAAEYRGERFWPSGAAEPAGRAGRVPGALHVPLDAVVNADGTYASVAELRAVFPSQIDDVNEVITYCTIGNRASIAWFVLSELIGRSGVQVYDGSWAEWGLLPSAPVETG
jgi:thiosulfate/3-mercaptopyruvate sulfurtransferase